MEPDFSGYATKANLVCTDGRTIMPEAFAHQDKETVPLVWQHDHNSPTNILGHAVLEKRDDGIYTQGYFNDSEAGLTAKSLVQHGDIQFLSIYANKLVERGKQVFHGAIREVSLVLAGANPGARIDYVAIAHADGSQELIDDEAVITTGSPIEFDVVEHADSGATIQDVYDSFDADQKAVVHYMIAAAMEAQQSSNTSAQHGADGEGDNTTNQEGTDSTMSHNVFEKGANATTTGDATKERVFVSHADMQGIIADFKKPGQTMKTALEAYALSHGITDLEVLFPDAKSVTSTPEFDKRRTEWVASVLGATTKRPFSRIKSLSADLTEDEARARGYIKGKFKKEEFFGLAKRVTTPTTVYKKQKLDRDDIIDITDFDIVVWLKAEMRLMMDEELARAQLFGDGRAMDDEDKIKDPIGSTEGAGIRSIANDHDLYAATINVSFQDDLSDISELGDAVLENRYLYKGSGNPTMYTTERYLTKLLMQRDQMGRRLYRNTQELADELRVSSIVPVEVMEAYPDLVAIIVNLTDYTLGADRGGELTTFDDFDIDYNQYKYLMETRVSGALTKLRSALVVRRVAASAVRVAPNAPAFNAATNKVTIPTQTGVVYKNADTDATLAAGDVTLADGQTLNVEAFPTNGYYFNDNVNDSWGYKYTA